MNLNAVKPLKWRKYARLVVAALAVTAPLAGAVNVYLIQTAPSPSTGAPITGGGSWIVNKPSGYYLGRAMVGTRFEVDSTTSANWHYGRAIDTVNMCGYVMPGSMGSLAGTASASCSTATSDMLLHRLNIGKNFNAAAHIATDGSQVSAGNCTVYYNYFYGTSFAGGANGGHWANAAGTTTAGYVFYRFETLDGGAAVVRDPNLGWGFVAASCVGRPATLYNDND